MGPKHTAEFWQEVVRVVLTSGLMRKQVASGFGIHCQAVSDYIHERGGTPLGTSDQTVVPNHDF